MAKSRDSGSHSSEAEGNENEPEVVDAAGERAEADAPADESPETRDESAEALPSGETEAATDPDGTGDDTENDTDVGDEPTGEIETETSAEHGDPAHDAGTDETDETASDDDAGDRADDAALAAALASAPLVAAAAAPLNPEPHHEDATSGTGGAHHDDSHHRHEDHEEGGKSLASKVLTGLILLLVGGGIALWGAPKIAPGLPDGLGPVKAWLLPGEREAARQIAALRDELGQRIDAVAGGPDEAAVAGMVESGVAAVRGELEARITALSDQVAAADSVEIEGRLSQLETRIEGLTGQLEAFGSGGDLSEAQLAEIGAFQAAVEGLRAEVSALAEQLGAQSQRIDEVEVAVTRRLDAARTEIETVTEEAEAKQTSAIVRAAVISIGASIEAGNPYRASLDIVAAETGVEPPPALAGAADSGVQSLGELRASFADAAHAAIRADIRARGGEGMGSRFAAFLEAQVASRSLTPRDGDDTDAVLSRADAALAKDDLAGALTEMEGLNDTAKAAMAGWLDAATARRDAVAAFDEFEEAIAAMN